MQQDFKLMKCRYPAQCRKNHKPVQLTKCPAACRGCGCCHYCASILVNISKRVSVAFLKKKRMLQVWWNSHTHTKQRVKHSVLILTVAQLKACWAQCEEVTWLIMHFNRRKIMQRKLKGTRNQRKRERLKERKTGIEERSLRREAD